jgi:hypothetical protein
MELVASIKDVYWTSFVTGRRWSRISRGEESLMDRARTPTEVGPSVVAFPRALDVVGELYLCRGEGEVAEYLTENNDLAVLLIDAFAVLNDVFGEYVQPVAMIALDREGTDERRLVVSIPTTEDAPGALSKMDRFDREWLIPHLDLCDERVAFTLDFQ